MNVLDKVFEAGVVGCGGAGFPTHVKLKTEVEYFIVNAAECEPLLRTDQYNMRNRAGDIIKAVDIIGDHLHAQHKVIATKAHYHDEIRALEDAITKLESSVEIKQMDNFYPAGDEQIMTYEVTGRVIPPAGIPSAVGVVVSNLGTITACADAFHDIPLTDKIITVTGEVAHPVMVKAPVGTPISEIISRGMPKNDRYTAILGGPMMGRKISFEEIENEYVTKTTSAVIILDENSHLSERRNTSIETMLRMARTSCVQCSFCTELCTRHMLGHPIEPHKIMRKMAYCSDIDEIMADNGVKQALICSECGVCEEFACPMGLQPRKINKIIKQIYSQEKVKYEGPERDEWTINPAREYRKVPSKRLAARMGVDQYYDFIIDDLETAEPTRVQIGLKQHIGASATLCVSVGQHVNKGQKIGCMGEGQMGANIHASIDGKVVSADKNNVVIERE